MSGVPMLTIGELELRGEASLQTGPFGTQLKASEYTPEGTPVINVRNIGFGDLRKDDLEFLPEGKAAKLWQHHLHSGDIVFGRKGAVERHALIDAESDGWIQGSDCQRLRLTSETVSEKYLSYYLRTAAHQDWMQALCSFGATMSSLNQDILRRLTFPAPPLGTQQKIAAILSAYDDLIANNQRRIALLERMAEDIYREWFVRLRFPGHEQVKIEKGVPQGWDFDVASKFFDHVKGKSYGGEELSENPQHMPFITLKSFNRGGGYRSGGLKYYSGRFKPEQIVNHGDVVMAVTDMTQNREVVGRVARVPAIDERGAVISLDVIKLVPKTVSASFLYSYLRLSGFGEYIKEFANGTNVLHLKPDVVTQQRVLMPPADLQSRFDQIAQPIHRQIDALGLVVAELESTRDALLPRLISGKLAVDGLDIRFPPGMEVELDKNPAI